MFKMWWNFKMPSVMVCVLAQLICLMQGCLIIPLQCRNLHKLLATT